MSLKAISRFGGYDKSTSFNITPIIDIVFLLIIFCIFSGSIYSNDKTSLVTGDKAMTVDFNYAFATPHRLTVSLPNSSDKTLVDVYPDYLRMKWSYENLLNKPLAAFAVPHVNWEIKIKPEIDGQAFSASSWHRAEGWLRWLRHLPQLGLWPDCATRPGLPGRSDWLVGKRKQQPRPG